MNERSGGRGEKINEFHGTERNAKTWKALSRSLKDRGYAIVTDGAGSWIVPSGKKKIGKPEARDPETKKSVLLRKNDSGGWK